MRCMDYGVGRLFNSLWSTGLNRKFVGFACITSPVVWSPCRSLAVRVGCRMGLSRIQARLKFAILPVSELVFTKMLLIRGDIGSSSHSCSSTVVDSKMQCDGAIFSTNVRSDCVRISNDSREWGRARVWVIKSAGNAHSFG